MIETKCIREKLHGGFPSLAKRGSALGTGSAMPLAIDVICLAPPFTVLVNTVLDSSIVSAFCILDCVNMKIVLKFQPDCEVAWLISFISSIKGTEHATSQSG